MKKLAALWVLPLLAAMLAGCGAAAPEAEPLPDKVNLHYFYDELCGSCDNTDAFDAIVAEKLAPVRDTYPYEIYRYNTYNDNGGQVFRQLCAEMGLEADSLLLPLLIAGGRVFQGHESIEQNIAEAYLVAGEDLFEYSRVYNPAEKKSGEDLFEGYPLGDNSITAVYFYRITCDECNTTKPLIDAIPATVTTADGTWPVEVVRINTRSGNNGERISAFFEAYAVPDDDRMVPILFLPGGYLAGYEAISQGLEQALAESGGLPFAYPPAV